MDSERSAESSSPRWVPIGSIDRRVLGVLAEKAKTTRESYPLSLNALTTGCNQKSNRNPVMQLSEEQVDESLSRLRPIGAASLIQGMGRVDRFRHHLYDWLGVDKTELAVMAELMLRGSQTVGELRSRASRMEPIGNLSELMPILSSLIEKGLVIALTPPGRGQVVTHALYLPEELERVRRKTESTEHTVQPLETASEAPHPADDHEFESLKTELAQTNERVRELTEVVDQLQSEQRVVSDELNRIKESLGI